MITLIEFLKALFLGIVEGITEWLPISSTGHLILVNEFMGEGQGFFETDLFLYGIQLGAILAIVTLYFRKLNPFAPSKSKAEKRSTWQMWFKVIVACLPAAVIGLLLNDFMENFENWQVISTTLILYGIGFILLETFRKKSPTVTDIDGMSYKTALLIGAFQVLSIIPGTSRSGSTILGAMILGCSREIAAEFSFFLAIPVMVGVSFLKLVTFDGVITQGNWIVLAIAMVTAYAVSMVAVKFLTSFVKKHDFKVFGWYRIALAIIVVGYFLIVG
ncbi:MAG: undecaprenyl-diphosphate phosphatase [Ruminococcaceae bacterium]|nr:undecaprenyl-diphosphate phosphatase [Oscillospiraceae bacterium]